MATPIRPTSAPIPMAMARTTVGKSSAVMLYITMICTPDPTAPMLVSVTLSHTGTEMRFVKN